MSSHASVIHINRYMLHFGKFLYEIKAKCTAQKRKMLIRIRDYNTLSATQESLSACTSPHCWYIDNKCKETIQTNAENQMWDQ